MGAAGWRRLRQAGRAAQQGRQLLQRCSNEGAAPRRPQDGSTPLHYAADMGNVAAVEVLLAAGAAASAANISGTTPLHYAAYR